MIVSDFLRILPPSTRVKVTDSILGLTVFDCQIKDIKWSLYLFSVVRDYELKDGYVLLKADFPHSKHNVVYGQ